MLLCTKFNNVNYKYEHLITFHKVKGGRNRDMHYNDTKTRIFFSDFDSNLDDIHMPVNLFILQHWDVFI